MCPPTQGCLLSRRPGSTRSPCKHKRTKHTVPARNTPVHLQSTWWHTAHTADSAGRVQGTWCHQKAPSHLSQVRSVWGQTPGERRPRAPSAGLMRWENKACTAFQSVYNKVKGQHAAVWASLRATLDHRNEMLLPSPKGRLLQEPPDGRAQTGTGT